LKPLPQKYRIYGSAASQNIRSSSDVNFTGNI